MRDQPPHSGNPYATLGLEPGAPMADVKRAYRQLAKAYHPDSAGETALPTFLAIHEAYEAIRTGRPMSRTRGSAQTRGPAPAPSEPWRADPERARAARERARRGTGTGPGRGGPGSAAGTADSTRRTGTSGGTRGSGRRNVRKATLGSTSYDDARDPNDATWSGASWYGPSTGEYWIVNPREYADPRKHGPEYQSRARRPGGPADVMDEVAPPSEAPHQEPAAPAAAPGGEPRGEAGTWSFDREEATAGAASIPRAERPPRSQWAGSPAGAGAGASESTGGSWGSAWPRDVRGIRRARSAAFRGRTPRDWIGGPADDPIRRLGLALVAWPPLGLAAASMIGQATGCTLYSATCSGTEPLLPWLAQAAILGLLLLLPPIARILAGGSIAVLFALVPITAFLVAVGGSGAPQAGFALTFFLVIAWLVGIVWGAWQLLRRDAGRAAP